MAASICPHCGSKYITFSEKKESFEKTTEVYYCQSCKKSFEVVQKKVSADGTWLMTIYDDKSYSGYGKILEIYKTETGYKLNQKCDGKYQTRYVTPKTKVQYNEYVRKYHLWFDTFTYFNDADGMYITATLVKMNPELAAEALKNEAMRIVHKGGEEFAIGGAYNETTLLNDIHAWFCSVLVTPASTNSGGGCYVATAVYGSYDCPQVWTLRRFRDDTLAGTWYGRLFIRTYYAVSPTLVKWFGKTQWFRNLWRPVLDRMVKKLEAEGVSDRPYADKY